MKFFFLAFFLVSIAQADLKLDPSLEKSVDSCKKTGKPLHLYFFKQWHLGPKLDTKDIKKSLSLPQEQNQKSLFDQLDSWVSAGKLTTIVAEGCSSGEMSESSALKFNGWDISSLKDQSAKADYDTILTSVPLKLEAKYGSKIHVICGDDDELARQNALAFSDARGEVGYLTRLDQYKNNPSQAAGYLEDVVKLYHLPAGTTVAQAMAKLKEELKKSISQVESLIQKRNEHLVEVALKHASEDAVIVFGGAHTAGVKMLFDKNGADCEILEPNGYPADDRDEAKMISRLKELLIN